MAPRRVSATAATRACCPESAAAMATTFSKSRAARSDRPMPRCASPSCIVVSQIVGAKNQCLVEHFDGAKKITQAQSRLAGCEEDSPAQFLLDPGHRKREIKGYCAFGVVLEFVSGASDVVVGDGKVARRGLWICSGALASCCNCGPRHAGPCPACSIQTREQRLPEAQLTTILPSHLHLCIRPALQLRERSQQRLR
jgi:hypothetical protein